MDLKRRWAIREKIHEHLYFLRVLNKRFKEQSITIAEFLTQTNQIEDQLVYLQQELSSAES